MNTSEKPILRNIFLTGFMGTGKTCVGRLLAGRLHYKFVDMDSLIKQKARKSIPEIFAEWGESSFRKLEQDVLFCLAERDRQVVATGGGIVICEANRLKMMEKGVIVCLTASTSEICNRLAHSTNRPLIKVKNPAKKIASLIDTRRHWYKICDHEIDTTQLLLEDVVEKILAIVTGKYRILPL